MGFAEDVYRLASQVSARKEHCKGNEELTKNSLILPFFQVLGYDIHDPSVLHPEYRAGFAANKEKVDYAVFLKGAPVLFVEAKPVASQLDNYDAQLAKYFNSTPGVKLAVITNGVRYKFFTDLKAPNLMDSEPFFEFEIESIRPEEIAILDGFRADCFDPSGLVTRAENLVYLRTLKKKVRSLFRDTSDEFVRFMCSDIYQGRITANVLERLTPLVQQAMSDVLVDMVSQGLTQEIAKTDEVAAIVPSAQDLVPAADGTKSPDLKTAVVTTEEELAAFNLVCETIKATSGGDSHVAYKDTASYFVIHLEKPSRWFMRLLFGADKKSVVFHIPLSQANAILGDAGKVENYNQAADSCRVVISDISDIKALVPLILAAYRAAGSEVSA